MSRKKNQAKLDSISKEDLSIERTKMEKIIADRLLGDESLTSEEILMLSEAFDSLINEFMKNNYV